MAEQVAKQEQGKADKVERPKVRRVWLEPGAVFLPDAARLAGDAGRAELDVESNVGIAHKLALSTTALGVVAQYVGVRHNGGAKPVDVPHRVLIPWGPAKLVEVGPDWTA